MASVWKRLQRVNKRAAKFQYTASYHRIELDTSPKWKPTKLCVAWTRRSRRVVSEPREWEPSLKDPLSGSVLFTVPDNQTVAVTLFKDSRTNELEDKDWTFVLEDISPTGKRRRLAVCPINMRKYASLEPTQRTLQVQLEPTTQKIVKASLQFTLHCVLLREGQATDEDMQSLASLLSVNNNSDIAVLEDLDEDDYTLSDNSTRQVQDFRQHLEEMTQSLTNSDIASPISPNSIQSLNYDNSRTATTPITHNLDLKTPVGERNDFQFHGTITPSNEEKPLKDYPEYANVNVNTMTNVAINVETPKFTSTPNKNIIAEINPDPSIKGLSYKSDTNITAPKRNLKPLELNLNLNNISSVKNDIKNDLDKTPVSEVKKIEKADKFAIRLEKENTPVQDLLEWCQGVTCEYKSCCVTNLTTSFRSGLAFCAIIHRFRPDLIDFSGLQPDAAESNVRTALDASATLGIPQVLSVADVCTPPSPDRLAIMTYLFQLRAHFTGSELQVEQLGNDETESSYLVGRHDTDGSLDPDLFSREVVTRRSLRMERQQSPMQESQLKQAQDATPEKINSPTAMKDVKDMFFHQSKTILNKMLSPPPNATKASAKWFTHTPNANNESMPATRTEKLMTRNELNDPFGSDDETETDATQQNDSKVTKDSAIKALEPVTTDPLMVTDNLEKECQPAEKLIPTPELPKLPPQILSRHDELKERARLLLEQTKREARDKEKVKRQKEIDKNGKESNLDTNGEVKKPVTEEERHAILRERARKLIADARAGIVSPTSPLSPSRQRSGTVEIISKQSVMEEIAAEERIAEERLSPKSSLSDEDTRRSSLQSFTSLIDRLTPDKDDLDIDNEEGPETGSYIQSELDALEHEQKAIDETAAALEKQLRAVMESNDNTEEEDRLMSQWFNLVNKKNALLRRQMQLNILEQEEDLSRRCELLARELRLSLGVEEWRKTPGQKRRERLLLQELLAAVNERDRLVQVQDEQEKAIEEDAQIEHNLSQVDFQRDKNNCILQ